jgi:6-phosphogluconolactonase (cycloisomerase 2 family)
MGRKSKYIAVCLSFLMLAPFSTDTFAKGPKKAHKGGPKHSHSGGKNFRAGAVYVLTNQTNNMVAVFRRNAKGTLTFADQFPTGGAGDPTPQPPDPTADPLASQGALIISQGNRFLLAVNAGSNQISVLKIKKNELQMVDVVNSGGIRPISLALHHDLLYVLNEGGTPNITGFDFDEDGTLTPLAGSTRPLIGGVAADPAQIGFSHNGDLLVVTEKAGNRLNTYTIDDNGLPSAPIANASNGMTPFGFAFNNADTLVVSEAFGGALNQSAASSYSASDAGVLSVISGSVPNAQTAACWVVITNNGKLAFVSNTASGTISSYFINPMNGSLTLLNPVAANTGMGSAPIDMTLSVNSRILFVHLGGTQSVAAFRIGGDGSLTPVDTAGGLPLGAQGIAAK